MLKENFLNKKSWGYFFALVCLSAMAIATVNDFNGVVSGFLDALL